MITGSGTGWRFGGMTTSSKSSLTILANSLLSNETYQLMVKMQHRQDASLQATGYLLVKVEEAQSQRIVIGCVVSRLCAPDREYQIVNPTTQVALFSACMPLCPSIINVTWTVYQGTLNSSSPSSVVQWTPFPSMSQFANSWFFGECSSSFCFSLTSG